MNADLWAHRPEIEVTHDLVQTPWPFGDDSFDEIQAYDIMEHLPAALPFINELWRISKPDAKVFIHTSWAGPQSGARQVWRDPTHVRPYTEESMAYFDPIGGGFWFENYGKFYSQSRFEVLAVEIGAPDCIGYRLRAIKE